MCTCTYRYIRIHTPKRQVRCNSGRVKALYLDLCLPLSFQLSVSPSISFCVIYMYMLADRWRRNWQSSGKTNTLYCTYNAGCWVTYRSRNAIIHTARDDAMESKTAYIELRFNRRRRASQNVFTKPAASHRRVGRVHNRIVHFDIAI